VAAWRIAAALQQTDQVVQFCVLATTIAEGAAAKQIGASARGDNRKAPP
jgi:hypothetical protein